MVWFLVCGEKGLLTRGKKRMPGRQVGEKRCVGVGTAHDVSTRGGGDSSQKKRRTPLTAEKKKGGDRSRPGIHTAPRGGQRTGKETGPPTQVVVRCVVGNKGRGGRGVQVVGPQAPLSGGTEEKGFFWGQDQGKIHRPWQIQVRG